MSVLEGLQDFTSGMKMWRLLTLLGWEDVKQRYVRTYLGPFWLVIGMTLWSGAMAFVMASLFGMSVITVLPSISVGVAIWTFISSSLVEGTTLFIQSASIVHSVPFPISAHVFRFLIRNTVIFFHNIVVIGIVLLSCHVKPTQEIIWVVPGLILIFINLTWSGALLGMLNTRFRDVQQLVTSSITIISFLTPIFWDKMQLKKHFWIANVNPFYHAVELFRQPLLGQMPAWESWAMMGGLAIAGSFATLFFFSKYKHRVIYWL